jgi:uncharacterized protein YndB with AHSA1/START domain
MGAMIESVVVIERPVGEVFEFLLDLEKTIRSVDPDVESVEKTPEGPIGAGTTFRVRRRARGRAGEFTRYTAIEPNRKIEFEARFGPVAPTGSLTFEQANAGTKVTFRGEPNPVGMFKLLSPLVVRKGQRAWDVRLARIKSILETSPS